MLSTAVSGVVWAAELMTLRRWATSRFAKVLRQFCMNFRVNVDCKNAANAVLKGSDSRRRSTTPGEGKSLLHAKKRREQ